ncbi:ankyrin repeat domain-containing protein [Wolbachia endosymbiont of Cantharis cryptica]|uniref:ankyrin repeat domain-containing protein n=1 Tax=Wolbachia endosymbiont of Cantharis cryptica TaxID=3066132 RepID=UPI00376F40CE
MGISALTTRLDECINEKREQERKDEQLYDAIERKVTKKEHKRKRPRGRDGTIKKCKKLFKEGASPEVLTKLEESLREQRDGTSKEYIRLLKEGASPEVLVELEESLREQEGRYEYYVERLLPVLGRKISKELDPIKKEKIGKVISDITRNSKYCFTHNQNDRRDSEAESGYGSDVEDNHKVEISNGTTHNNVQLLKAIKNGNNRKFKKYLKDCTDISSIKDEKENNILHLIASLEKKQKCKFLGTLIKTATKEDLTQLVDSKNQDRKTPLQVALIDKITKEKHESNTIRSSDNTLKFLVKLLEHEASLGQLGLSTKELQDLKEEQKTYYRNFLEKLAESVKKPELKQEIKTQIKETIAHTINTPDSNSNYPLHLAIKNGNKKLFEELLQKGADVSLKDANGNHALHLIVTLEKKQKLEFLNISLEVGQKEQFIKAVNDENNNDQTPLQKLLFSKVKKEEHSSESVSGKVAKFLKRPFTEYDDHTIESAIRLFELGAKVDDLQLSKEELQNLGEKRKTYYDDFLKKLAESVKKSELDQEIKNSVIIRAAEIIYDGYPLHKTVLSKDKNKFSDLLQSGYDITNQDKDGNNALHLIVKPKTKQKLELLNILLKAVPKEQFIKAVNDKNKNEKEQTPLHQLLQYIEKKSGKQSHTGKKFEKTKRYETLELLLKNGADITAQDKEGNNALHYIASFEGKQKVACLELILNLKDEFSKAANAANKKKQTPLQVALITKTTKDKHNLVNPKSRDNTIKFCIKLLQNGVDPKQLILPESLWNREYYTTIKGIENLIGRSLISDDMRTELKCNFGKKFKARDIVKYVNNVVCKVVTTLVFVALTCAVVFSAAQGSVTIATASSIIAAIGVCYLVFLNLENIYEGFKKLREKPTEEKQITPQGNASENDTQCNNSVQDIENKLNNSEKQEIQKPSDQPEHIESPPDTKISAISIMRQFMNKLDGIISKPSSLGPYI